MANILVAEDEPGIRSLLNLALKMKGHTVVTVENGQEALQKFQTEGSFDLLISDNDMPGHNEGVKLIQSIRAIKPEQPILFMSGRIQKGDELETLIPGFGEWENQGTAIFLAKPFTPPTLWPIVNELVRNAPEKTLPVSPPAVTDPKDVIRGQSPEGPGQEST